MFPNLVREPAATGHGSRTRTGEFLRSPLKTVLIDGATDRFAQICAIVSAADAGCVPRAAIGHCARVRERPRFIRFAYRKPAKKGPVCEPASRRLVCGRSRFYGLIAHDETGVLCAFC